VGRRSDPPGTGDGLGDGDPSAGNPAEGLGRITTWTVPPGSADAAEHLEEP